uniref:PRC-barrel domain containing protein n=1 Tax=Streptomyces sp. NBC_01393 TaxID=2903851 RepID=A0AAU3IEP0_9ACTN
MIGYKVEAADGDVGKVDKHSDDIDSSHLVTGVWIFGKHVLLPAGTFSKSTNKRRSTSRSPKTRSRTPRFDNVGYHEQVGSYYQNQLSI